MLPQARDVQQPHIFGKSNCSIAGWCVLYCWERRGICFPVIPRDGSTQTNKGFWFILLCLKFNGFKSSFTSSVMVPKLKQIIFSLLVFFFTGAFRSWIFPQKGAVCMACCSAPSHGKKTVVYMWPSWWLNYTAGRKECFASAGMLQVLETWTAEAGSQHLPLPKNLSILLLRFSTYSKHFIASAWVVSKLESFTICEISIFFFLICFHFPPSLIGWSVFLNIKIWDSVYIWD